MSPTWIGIIGILVMLVVFLSRMPVAYVMAMVGFVGFSIMISLPGGLAILSRDIYEVFSSYGLTTIPLFILMGQLAFNSGISRRLYETGVPVHGEHARGAGHGHGLRVHGLRRRVRVQPGHGRDHGHGGPSRDEAILLLG